MAPERQWTNSDVEFIDRRINEFDRRQDTHIKEKIEALEKLLNLTISTKADALAVLISRLQSDNTQCAIRCSKQVQLFSVAIESLQLAVQKCDTSALNKRVDDLESRDSVLSDIEAWKDSFWIKNIFTAVVTATAVVNVALYGFTWLLDYIAKVKEMTGAVGM